ncbi:MAG TPA: AAA family ATPase [Candidatus Tumulicola sp.]|jgi:DNA-binding SARP family transcriptional activator
MAKPLEQPASHETLEIRLFGQLEIRRGGVPVVFSTPRKSLEVLAYLLLNRSAPAGREYLAFMLYPDDEESSARAKLRATLNDMPKILPAPFAQYVIVDSDKVRWNPDAPLWLDVDAFGAAAADPQRHADAIDLYRGDLLPQIYDEWIEAPRETYRNAYVRCLDSAIAAARSKADFPAAIEAARKALTIDPWREDVVRRIVSIRYQSGDRAGALTEHDAFVKRLRTEMDAEPMAETIALADRIRKGLEPTDEPETLAPSPSATPVLPFVGREDEFAELIDGWSRAVQRQGNIAFVGGEGGIGKSRLSLEFAHAVEDRGGRVLSGATSFPEAMPYEAVTDALRSAIPLLSALPQNQTLATLATIVPELRRRFTLPELAQLAADSERIRLFDAVARALTDLAAQRPLLCILEDLQWAQQATCDMLEFLTRRIAGTRIMLLITYRNDEMPSSHPLHKVRAVAQRAAGITSITLRRLDANDIAKMHSLLGAAAKLGVAELAEVSAGHPHFLTQLILEGREDPGATVSETIELALGRRLERLSDQARTAAEIAAYMGDYFSIDAVREVSAWDDTTLGNALDELLDRRIVRENPARSLFDYAFAHHAIQQAIVKDVPPQRAATRRRRIARVLESLYLEHAPELVTSIARQYDLAGDAENAARRYLDAVRYLISVGALEEAGDLAERGTELATEPRRLVDLRFERVTVESRRGDRDAWERALDALEAAVAADGDPEKSRLALLRRFEFADNSNDTETESRIIERLRAAVDGSDPHWLAQLRLAESTASYDAGHLAEAATAAEHSLAACREAGDVEMETRVLLQLAAVQAERGNFSEADRVLEQTRAVVERSSSPQVRLNALRSEWPIVYRQRRSERAAEVAAELLALAEQIGDRPTQGRAHDRLAVSLTATGRDVASARRHWDQSRELTEESGQIAFAAGSLSNAAVLETKLGFFERGLELTERSLEAFEKAGLPRGLAVILDNLVLLRAYTGRFDGAREAARRASELADELDFAMQKASIVENLAFVEAQTGDFELAIALAEESVERRKAFEPNVWSCKTLADMAIWQANVGNLPAAREAIRLLYEHEDDIVRSTDFPTYCYWAAAQIFHLDGRSTDERRALQKGRQIMQTMVQELDDVDRAQYLGIPWHADIIRASDSNEWPSPPR